METRQTRNVVPQMGDHAASVAAGRDVGSNVPLVRVRNNRLEAEAPAGALGR